MTFGRSHAHEAVDQALDAWSRSDNVEAERLFQTGIALSRAAGEDVEFALGRYGAFLLEQRRSDDAAVVLNEAMEMGTDIPAIWGDYLSILAERHDTDGMIKTFDRLPRRIAQSATLVRWLLPYAGGAARSDDLAYAELFCRTIRDEARKRHDWEGAWTATGRHGEILERMGRIEEAIAEWQNALDAGSDDPTTANRLSLTLDRAKRYGDAADVIRAALERGLPASTEETLRKRLERLERRSAPGSAKQDVSSFSIRSGDEYARLVMQRRISPPIRDLAVVGQTAYCLGFTKDTGTLTRIDLDGGGASPRIDLPALDTIQVSPSGWAIGTRRQGRVGQGSSFLAFLDPECQLHATADLHDAISEVSYGMSKWFVGCRDGRLYAFDLTGRLVWEWVTPGADPAPDNPYFRPCPYHVAATDQFVAISTMGDIFAIGFDGSLLWHLKVPDQGPLTMTVPIGGPLSDAEAWRTLEVQPGTSDEAVRHAYRVAALATHPDRHPGDPDATDRFRRVQSAYEAILASAHTPAARLSMVVTISTSTMVTTLDGVANTVLVGSSDGVLSTLDANGEVLMRRVVGRSDVKPVLDEKGMLRATFCDGVLSFFDGTSIINAADVEQYPTHLRLWRNDVLCAQGASARAFDHAGRNVWSVDFAKRISGLSTYQNYLVCGAGTLVVFERT
jgi:tetratricopeptide (TPR) repeat protein